MEKKLSILYIGQTPTFSSLMGAQSDIDFIVRSNLQAAEIYLKTGQKPDAILSEHFLSGGNGIDFHDKLRKDVNYNEVAFILLSHEFKEELIKKALDKKIDDFFVLPFQPEKIDGLISRIKFLSEYHKKFPVKPVETAAPSEFTMPLSKRIFDVVVAGSALLILSPLLLVVIIAIMLESKGKPYYTSKRFGRSQIFDFYKLRSMRTGADAELKKLAKEKNQYIKEQKSDEIDFTSPCPGCQKLPNGQRCSPLLHIGDQSICEDWYNHQKREIAKGKPAFTKISNDPRVTRVGKFIRNTSIDELPQLFNVLKGDMSIVGNRPLPIYEVEHLLNNPQKQTDQSTSNSENGNTSGMIDMAARCLAPAGITGLWQVELRGKGGDMSEEERKHLDNEYADHFVGNKYSFFYDLGLVLRTFKALFQKDSV